MNCIEENLFVLLLVCLFASSCTTKEAPTVKPTLSPQAQATQAPAAPPAVNTQIYHGTGRVTTTNPKFPSVEIDHDEIVGLMPAMRMEFFVNNEAMIKDLKPGDKIEFTLQNGVGGLKITEIKKL
jgi:protein SCO1/2